METFEAEIVATERGGAYVCVPHPSSPHSTARAGSGVGHVLTITYGKLAGS